ncbi:MAG: saccharopine dehydrogenase NADP-binding domain-containing protein [Bacteroidales bacterium]|nr:saccharopine dehydrogenase NADP-binding domain-containing protein [Bacteroidales bacterium]
MKKLLVLGAGMVAKPLVNYLAGKGYNLTLADIDKKKAAKIAAKNKNIKVEALDVNNLASLEQLIEKCDLAISLLPYIYHIQVGLICVKHKKNMVTTSYIKPEMQALDTAAKKAGIIILNEVGLDPGIDHLSAKRIIDNIHNKGGKVIEFFSICGALPAPEAADNKLKYKFSWSPKGVVMAGNNDAKYLKNGKIINIKTADLFKDTFFLNEPLVGKLEVYPNRDSLSYIDLYGIPETKTMYRGTFRYKGWCETLDIIKKIKLTTDKQYNFKGKTYAGMTAMLIGAKGTDDIRQKVADFTGLKYNSYPLKAMEWLGLFDNIKMNREKDSPLNILSDLMISKMMLGEKERDMVIMEHNFIAEYPNKTKELI